MNISKTDKIYERSDAMSDVYTKLTQDLKGRGGGRSSGRSRSSYSYNSYYSSSVYVAPSYYKPRLSYMAMCGTNSDQCSSREFCC